MTRLPRILLLLAFLALAGGALGQEINKPDVYENLGTYKLDQDGEQLCGVGGIQRWRREAAVVDQTKATVVMCVNDAPAVEITGDGCDVERINFWRDFYGGERKGGTCIKITDWGKHSFDRLGFANWDIPIHLAGGSHCDNIDGGSLYFNNCRTCIQCNEAQASSLDFDRIVVSGQGETVFDMDKGGNIHVGSLVINEPRLIFRLRKTSSNTCTIIVDNLKVDSNAAGWRLLQMDRPGPINLIVRGQVGQDAKMGEKPIVIPDAATKRFTPPTNYQHIDIALWGPNPNPDRGVLWVPTLGECRP